MEYSEKRDFQRMALGCSMEYQLANIPGSHEGKVINLSAKGVLFVSGDKVQTGDRLSIKLSPVNNITPPMSADIEVTRCEKQSDSEFQVAAKIVQIR